MTVTCFVMIVNMAEEGGQGQKVTNESSRELMFCAVNLQM